MKKYWNEKAKKLMTKEEMEETKKNKGKKNPEKELEGAVNNKPEE